MATFDKYDPISGGFRAKLKTALTLTNGEFFGAVSIDNTGRAIAGFAAGAGSRLAGITVKKVARQATGAWGTSPYANTPNPAFPIGALAGDVIDIMTAGEIVDLDKAVFVAGTRFYAKPTGAIVAEGASAAGDVPIGFTVEAGRLIVRYAVGTPAKA